MPYFGLGCIVESAAEPEDSACPVCGEEAEIERWEDYYNQTAYPRATIYCGNCSFSFSGDLEDLDGLAEKHRQKYEAGASKLVWQWLDNNTGRLLNDSGFASGNGIGALCRNGKEMLSADGSQGTNWLTGDLDALQSILNDYERMKVAETAQKKRP